METGVSDAPTDLVSPAPSSSSSGDLPRAGALRRRLSTKTAGPAFDSDVALPALSVVELPAVVPVGPALPDGASCPPADNDEELQEDLRFYRRFCQRYRRWILAKIETAGDTWEARRLERLRDLRKMTRQVKVSAAEEYFKDNEDYPDKERVLAHLKDLVARQKDGGKSRFVEANGVFLTFNGPWGEVDYIDLPPPGSEDLVDEVCKRLQEHERVVQLWEALKEAVNTWQDKLFVQQAAYSLELCTGTLMDSRSIRVHGHVFLRSFPKKIRVRSADMFCFKGGLPHKTDSLMGGGIRVRGHGSNAGFYYLQCPKIGTVFQGGTGKPFRDYLVNGEWIMSLIQAGKMSYKNARAEIIRSSKNLPRLLPALDRWHVETQRIALQAHMEEVQRDLEAIKKPFRRIDAVADWIASHQVNAMRYKFLVLCGGSGLGKTQYAKSLVEAGRTLELNMASAPEPDLREYDHNLHDLILFDECAPKQILRQKKLFQCPAVEVGLAASATSCHAYKVWVHKKLFVVATNVWQHEIARLPCDDASWLAANSVVVEVLEPLWEM